MTETDCARAAGAAAEFALGVLPGRDRIDLIAHIERCPGCRARLVELTSLADNLIALVPDAEPPAGFETRVLRAVGADAAPVGRASWWHRSGPRALVAAVLAAAVAAAGWGARDLIVPPSPSAQLTAHRPADEGPGSTAGDAAPDVVAGPRLVQFAVLISNGTRIGQVYAYPGPPSWVYMAVDTDQGDKVVSCQLLYRDGPPVPLGTFQLEAGYAAWGSPMPADHPLPTGAQLVDERGAVVASARFG